MELSLNLKLSGGDNWVVWKFHMEVILKGRRLFGIVSGVEGEPAEGENKKVWVQIDATAQELILDSNTDFDIYEGYASVTKRIATTESENVGIEGEGYSLRPRRNIKKPSFVDNYHLCLCNMVDDDPKTFYEAVSSVYSNKWREAMDRELIALRENDTWEWVTKLSDCTVINYKWVFRLKTDEKEM
ncbi:hypothetical protein PR048_013060 [Dryococelus australis]|uniref:Retrotransposon Copia-like N-terminal domain-containing protein n=1 Tax=Dryococelus australis TaxID=614101 RepID=A0ABQ9HR35_9NEOP|nr:hypothetical protein PR048_013060 [Dryococelus australis]